MKNIELLYEKILNTIPNDVQKELSRKSVRKSMPEDAFLLPSERKFPIKRPGSDKIDIKLVYAAYVRAKQWSAKNPEYEKVALEAKRIFIKHNGSEILKLKLEGVDFSDSKIRSITQILGVRPNITPDDPSIDLDMCICPNCDYQCELGIDDTICEEKECPKCGEFLMPSVFNNSNQNEFKDDEQNSINRISENSKTYSTMTNKMRTIMEKNSKINRMICSNCNIVVQENVGKHNPICPNCGQNFEVITESIDDMVKHFTCPNCKTMKPYTKVNDDICPICESLMVVFAMPIIKKDKGLPTVTD